MITLSENFFCRSKFLVFIDVERVLKSLTVNVHLLFNHLRSLEDAAVGIDVIGALACDRGLLHCIPIVRWYRYWSFVPGDFYM